MGSLPSTEKDAKEIDQIFTDNLKRQGPEPLARMKKKQPASVISCGANLDSQDRDDWKVVASGSGRKARYHLQMCNGRIGSVPWLQTR